MAKIVGGVPPFIGTRDNLTIYLLNGEYIIRAKSSLTGKRVKRDPAFAKTMKFAGWLKQASRIASSIYRQMPADERIYKQYRQLTGKAMSLLKEGFDTADVITMLEAVYLPQLMENTDNRHTSECCGSDCKSTLENSSKCNGCAEYAERRSKYRKVSLIEYSCRCTSNCNNESSHRCAKYNRKHRSGNVNEYSCRCIGNCNNAFSHACTGYRRKRASRYVFVYVSEYIKSCYNWGDRPQRAVQVGITGCSYLKYADATNQGLNRNPKAHPPQKSLIARNFKELQPVIPACNREQEGQWYNHCESNQRKDLQTASNSTELQRAPARKLQIRPRYFIFLPGVSLSF